MFILMQDVLFGATCLLCGCTVVDGLMYARGSKHCTTWCGRFSCR